MKGFCPLCAEGQRFRSIRSKHCKKQPKGSLLLARSVLLLLHRVAPEMPFRAGVVPVCDTDLSPKGKRGGKFPSVGLETVCLLSWPLSWAVTAQRRRQGGCKPASAEAELEEQTTTGCFSRQWLWHADGRQTKLQSVCPTRVLSKKDEDCGPSEAAPNALLTFWQMLPQREGRERYF